MTLMHPSGIWLYLAQFFTRDVLAGLMTADYTSRAMLSRGVEASLEELYRQVDFRFLYLEDGTTKRLWKRAVADRVRVLSIGPYFVCDALDNSRRQPLSRTSQIVRALLARFRNLENYHILWHERPTTTLRRDAPKYDDATLCLASAFLAASAFFCAILEEFSLCIRDDHAGDLDAAGYIMVHHLARFMNNVHHTLQSFSFETSLAADFSPLFSALGVFTRLSVLALSIPTSDPHLGDPQALNGFLRLHGDTLERLSLRGFCMHKSRKTELDGRWLSRCLTDVTFSSLHTLNVGTSFLPLEVVILCVQQWASTLTALDITGQYLSYDSVADVLRELSDNRLDSLTVGVACLCPQLVDMFAAHLPGLTKINLRIRSVSAHRLEAPKSVGRRGASARFLGSYCKQTDSQSGRFCAEMSTRKYEAWKLRDVGVWMFTKKLQHQDWCADAIRDSVGQN
ncbi:hypothetical protein B0H14DRAFT_2945863 [Mycena olivaceomarginata]|nr:hypothetical protein B0H14DRAFT_2945863 [Mycena olivaceomarginata]